MKAKPVRMKLGKDDDIKRPWYWIYSVGSWTRSGPLGGLNLGICEKEFNSIFPRLKLKLGQGDVDIEVTIRRVGTKKKARKRGKK